MSLSGSGVIAIWNDITEEGRANFYEEDREHIPERVGIQAFMGRRYIALSEHRSTSLSMKFRTGLCSLHLNIWRD